MLSLVKHMNTIIGQLALIMCFWAQLDMFGIVQLLQKQIDAVSFVMPEHIRGCGSCCLLPMLCPQAGCVYTAAFLKECAALLCQNKVWEDQGPDPEKQCMMQAI